jgi:hypothetical protein
MTANQRRENGHASYRHIDRDEYVQRAHEFAPRGESLAKKLTEHDVIAIRQNRNGLTDKHQAAIFGVSASMIYKIRKYEKWGHVA